MIRTFFAVIVLGSLLVVAGCGGGGGDTTGGGSGTTVIGENPTTPPVTTEPGSTTSPTDTSGGDTTGGGDTTTAAPKLKPGQAAVGVVDNPKLGPILVNSEGFTLYVYDFDTGNLSQCYGSCIATWHPLTTRGPVLAETGVDASLLGTTHRDDGIIQVTCNGHPVYTYGGDKVAGSVAGNDKSVTTHGNNYHYTMPSQWHVLGPDCVPEK